MPGRYRFRGLAGHLGRYILDLTSPHGTNHDTRQRDGETIAAQEDIYAGAASSSDGAQTPPNIDDLEEFPPLPLTPVHMNQLHGRGEAAGVIVAPVRPWTLPGNVSLDPGISNSLLLSMLMPVSRSTILTDLAAVTMVFILRGRNPFVCLDTVVYWNNC